MPRLFSYVVKRDFGFAPNPFYGLCTLATCKPEIRRHANVGDWIVGTGSSTRGKKGYVVFVMCVTEAVTFNEYWENARFREKRPNLRGSKKQAFGDNIYFKDGSGVWHQADSHHSYTGGSRNHHNIGRDTKADRVLLSTEYAYWGDSEPQVPAKLKTDHGIDICAHRGHKCNFPDDLVKDFEDWFRSLGAQGYLGAPADWRKSP